METLYMYKLDEQTGNISKLAIDSYEQGRWVSNKSYYRYRKNGMTYYCYTSDLDRVKTWHIYTFEEDDARAKRLFIEALQEKHKQLERQAKRYDKVVAKLID